MTIRNLDYECFQEAMKEHREFQADWLKIGYAPNGFYVKDFCLFEHAGEFHLFHIAGTPGVSCCLPGNEIWFGHATTRDFLTWETHAPCFYINPGSWDGGHVFAPFVLQKDDWFWMFYTGCTPENTQRIGLARSQDLFNWKRVGLKPIIRPEKFEWAFCPTENGAACRDPHVSQVGNEFWLYYTAVTKQGHGCVARSTSHNLLDWKDQGPAFIFPGTQHCESSNVQELDGKYLLFFGGHHHYWSYVVSDTPEFWPNQTPRPLGERITAMEVIRKQGPKWLVAFFKMGVKHSPDGFRLFLGTINWATKDPQIQPISTPPELKEFFE